MGFDGIDLCRWLLWNWFNGLGIWLIVLCIVLGVIEFVIFVVLYWGMVL